jgi:hypothetical protein
MMKKMWRIPALEAVCITGYLGVFLFLQLVVLPQYGEVLEQFGGRPPDATILVMKVQGTLQPPWLAVLLDLEIAGFVLALCRMWHARMPAWPWVPLRVIFVVGLTLVLSVELMIAPNIFEMSQHLYEML